MIHYHWPHAPETLAHGLDPLKLKKLVQNSSHALSAMRRIPLQLALDATNEVVARTETEEEDSEDGYLSFLPHITGSTGGFAGICALLLSMYNLYVLRKPVNPPTNPTAPNITLSQVPLPPPYKTGYSGLAI
jgi:hypothetical protein